MSQCSSNTFVYNPVSLGHPHEPAEPQLTEPFWQQYPTWTQPDRQYNTNIYFTGYYYPSTHVTAMDSQTIYIGSKTKNSSKMANPNNATNNHRDHTQDSRPKGKVEVYIGNEKVGLLPLGILVRFSKVAATAFPKPGVAKGVKKASNVQEGAASRDWAEDDDKELDVEKLTADVGKLGTGSPTEESSRKAKEGGVVRSSSSRVTEEVNPLDKKLDVYLKTLWIQPSDTAMQFAFNWMHEAKLARPGEPVLDYGVPRPEKISLEHLVDLYAAALSLGLRPFPHKLRHAIMSRVTVDKPLLESIRYVHEHLPMDDPVMTRVITSFYEHRDKYKSYEKEETDLIIDYVDFEDRALHDRFKEIEDNRKENYRVIRRRQGEARMQRFAEKVEGSEGKDEPLHDAVKGEATAKGAGQHRKGQKSENKA